MRLCIDIEADALEPTEVKNIWCIVVRDVDTNETITINDCAGYEVLSKLVSDPGNLFIGHNIINYDARVLAHSLNIHIPPDQLEDTLVLSHLHNYPRDGGHSLEYLAKALNMKKKGIDITDWSVFDPRIIDRCIEDTNINAKLYLRLKEKLVNVPKETIDCEYEMARICNSMHDDGFAFNRDGCTSLILELRERLAEIDKQIVIDCPPKIIKLKTKEKIEPFNPRSYKQMIEVLEKWGWRPTEYTIKRSPKICETNLATLPDTAPSASGLLMERLILATRVSTLESWLSNYRTESGRIHGEFRPIGTWTHRMAHRNPNMGNIAAEKSIKYRRPELVQLATKLGARLRELWCATSDCYLVGTDAESIQLRIFAHYINDDAFTKALLEGKKEDGTDPHSRNAKLLGCTRDSAKTFIYAFLLGAGDKKVGAILGTDFDGGRKAKRRFIDAYPGLKRLREDVIPGDAARGYFKGLDGRYVLIPGDTQRDKEHLALAGYLQNGEVVIMKHACLRWRDELTAERVPYRQVNFVHDEWQTEVSGTRDAAERVGQVQARSIQLTGEKLGLRCPMAGNYKVGKTWLETH